MAIDVIFVAPYIYCTILILLHPIIHLIQRTDHCFEREQSTTFTNSYQWTWLCVIISQWFLFQSDLSNRGSGYCVVNTLRPRQNGRHLPDDIFKCISLNENVWISTEISLKFARKGSINNIPALLRIMAWRRPGDKPLSEQMMTSLLTHICVTRTQSVNTIFYSLFAFILYTLCSGDFIRLCFGLVWMISTMR